MRFPTQFPSPRVLFSRFDCPIWVVAFFFPLSYRNSDIPGLLLRFSSAIHPDPGGVRRSELQAPDAYINIKITAPFSTSEGDTSILFI